MKINTSNNAELPQAPISRKAYLEIIARIYDVFGEGSEEADIMIEAVDFYIKHGYYSGNLVRGMGMAFMFLRYEIDIAIERSRVARERARLRREGTGCNEKVVPDIMPWRRKTPGKYTFEGNMIVMSGSRTRFVPSNMDLALRDVKIRYHRLRESLS